MDIEEYSKYKQVFTDEIPTKLAKYFAGGNWNTYLDLGCGDGSLLFALDKKGYFLGKKVFAVDLSENRINLVKKINENFTCFVADACDVKNINDGSIDFLVSSQLIEHVPNEEKMVQEISRMLSKNGTAYISTVFKKWYGWYFYRCNGKWVIDPTHLREYTKDSQLTDILNRNGFKILESKKILVWRSLEKKFGIKISIPIFGYYKWELICKKK